MQQAQARIKAEEEKAEQDLLKLMEGIKTQYAPDIKGINKIPFEKPSDTTGAKDDHPLVGKEYSDGSRDYWYVDEPNFPWVDSKEMIYVGRLYPSINMVRRNGLWLSKDTIDREIARNGTTSDWDQFYRDKANPHPLFGDKAYFKEIAEAREILDRKGSVLQEYAGADFALAPITERQYRAERDGGELAGAGVRYAGIVGVVVVEESAIGYIFGGAGKLVGKLVGKTWQVTKNVGGKFYTFASKSGDDVVKVSVKEFDEFVDAVRAQAKKGDPDAIKMLKGLEGHPNQVTNLPFGYKEKPFRRFVQRTHDEFAAVGYNDAQFFMQGSSASGVKSQTGKVLDARRGIKPSDYDVAIVSPKLLARAEELGLDVLSGPLKPDQIAALGLTDVQIMLSKASKGGIGVNFKIYRSVDDVYSYDKTIPFSLFGN